MYPLLVQVPDSSHARFGRETDVLSMADRIRAGPVCAQVEGCPLDSSFDSMHAGVWERWMDHRSVYPSPSIHSHRFEMFPSGPGWIYRPQTKNLFFCTLFPESRTSSLDALLR